MMSEENNNKLEDQDLENLTSEKEENVSEEPKDQEEAEISSEELIEKLNEEITSLKDQRLRAIAELENFRKRAEKDQSDALKYGISNFAKEIIDIRDNIERAQSSISDEAKSNESIKSVIEGIDLIVQSVISTFEKIGIKKIESLNEKFDHNLHQAMMEIENDDLEPGTIVQELIPGYTLHDRLLRPAMVGVSKKSKKNDDNADKSEPEEIKS
jgi:molecular chaperone GrpE